MDGMTAPAGSVDHARSGRKPRFASWAPHRLRWAPHRLADAMIDRQFRRGDARCALDPEWDAIESRRRTPGAATRVLLSEDLDWADFERQREIRARVAPDPVWMPVARFVLRRPLRAAARNVVFTVQRARRGWSDGDAWNADYHLCRVTAGLLRRLADAGHTWPGDPYATPEQWSAALRDRAAAIRAWSDSSARGTDDLAAEQEALRGAQEAFHWVADNLPSLWD